MPSNPQDAETAAMLQRWRSILGSNSAQPDPKIQAKQRAYQIKISTLQSELHKAHHRLVALDQCQTECRILKQRLQKLRKIKLTLEQAVDAYKNQFHASRRVAAAQIRDHKRYAAHCYQLYEAALEILNNNIRKLHGRMQVTYNCRLCGPQPISNFGVRLISSGTLCFFPYCRDCEKKRKKQSVKDLHQVKLKKMANNLVETMPLVSEELVRRFDEEVVHEMAEAG